MSINIVITRGVSSVSNNYTVTLSQFGLDKGIAIERPLSKTFVGPPTRAQQTGAEVAASVVDMVPFDVSPVINESREAQYVNQPMPGPVGMIMYMLTGNRTFTISAKFVSRTVQEAEEAYHYSNLLRSWLIPQGQDGTDSKGGRPPILRLNGYQNQFLNIPVVLSSLSINFPEDVDYIEVEGMAMVPIIQAVEVTVLESHRTSTARAAKDGEVEGNKASSSRGGYGQDEFRLAAFKTGTLPGY